MLIESFFGGLFVLLGSVSGLHWVSPQQPRQVRLAPDHHFRDTSHCSMGFLCCSRAGSLNKFFCFEESNIVDYLHQLNLLLEFPLWALSSMQSGLPYNCNKRCLAYTLCCQGQIDPNEHMSLYFGMSFVHRQTFDTWSIVRDSWCKAQQVCLGTLP